MASSTTAAVRHRRWLLDCGNDSVWLASDGVFASATSVEILLFALTASRSNEPTGDALPTRSGAKGRLRIPHQIILLDEEDGSITGYQVRLSVTFVLE